MLNVRYAAGSVASLVLVISMQVGAAHAAHGDCAQPLTSGSNPTASDCLFILKAAVGSQTCDPVCICDVNATGGDPNATDALTCLRSSVGVPDLLDCVCPGTTTTVPPTTTTTPPTTTTTVPTTTTTLTVTTTTTMPVDIYDPNVDGPWDATAISDQIDIDNLSLDVAGFYPSSGPQAVPYPLVIIAPGFQLPIGQYSEYAHRLATHGYVAVVAEYSVDLLSPDHVAAAARLSAVIDWAATKTELDGVVDTTTVGMSGHSLGGKLAVMATVGDARVKASITLDAVDGTQANCTTEACPDASALLPVAKPFGFLGETLDSEGQFQACAPASENFLTFYGSADTPSLAVIVNGAGHVSFLDDASSCGLVCSFCNTPTVDNATVNALARAYVVAFYQRYLKGDDRYEDYLTGATAQARYVNSGLVQLESK